MSDAYCHLGKFYLGYTDVDEWLERRNEISENLLIKGYSLSGEQMMKFQDRMAGIHRRLNDVLARKEASA
jgi:hypothetical protein